MLGIGSLLLMCSYAGLVTYAFYDIMGCDPIKIKVKKIIINFYNFPNFFNSITWFNTNRFQMVEKPDQIFPIFVMQVMGDIPCIPGLFVAGVFSGALSTVR